MLEIDGTIRIFRVEIGILVSRNGGKTASRTRDRLRDLGWKSYNRRKGRFQKGGMCVEAFQAGTHPSAKTCLWKAYFC
jgi:hypothetical protein